MGFINLGTRVGLAGERVMNYDAIRTVNCDDIIQVDANIVGTGNVLKILTVTIIYKFSPDSTFLAVQAITYTTSSVFDSLEFTSAEYGFLFTQAVSSISNTLTTINAPEVNEFNTAGGVGSPLSVLDGARSFSKISITWNKFLIMGFLNLGTRVGNGATLTPYVINFDAIRVINCDNVYQVAASITILGNGRSQLVISITYKFSQQLGFLLVQKITCTASSTRPNLEFTASEYAVLFTQAIGSVSNTLTTLNAPQVNEFNASATAPQTLIPIICAPSLSKIAI